LHLAALACPTYTSKPASAALEIAKPARIATIGREPIRRHLPSPHAARMAGHRLPPFATSSSFAITFAALQPGLRDEFAGGAAATHRHARMHRRAKGHVGGCAVTDVWENTAGLASPAVDNSRQSSLAQAVPGFGHC
jgi:hypothetical protein